MGLRRTIGPAALAWLTALALSSGVRAEVWIVDDSVRLDPVEGDLFEERHPAADGIDAGYHDRNPIWNVDDGEAHLLAARNEVVAFQVIIDGGSHAGVSIEVSDLVGPETLAAADHVRPYREWFVHVTRESAFCDAVDLVTSLGPGWYPDALIPLDAPVAEGFGQPFDVPDATNEIPGQMAAAFWVDVLVPDSAAPGWYDGSIQVRFDGATVEVPLRLEVRDITLPAFNAAGLGSVNYGGLGFEVLNGEAGREGLIPWFQEAHAHRLEIDALWLWPPRLDGGEVDWDAFRETWRPFMTGDAFTREQGYRGPSEGEPIRRFVLPNESNWPGPHNGWDDPWPIDPEAWQQALVDVEGILVEEGWTHVEAHLFLNGLDEPRLEETFALFQRYGELIDSAGLADRGNVRFRLDAGIFKSIGDVLPGWDVDRIFSEIGGAVDVWNENGGVAYVAADATLRRLEDHPDERWWFYNTCSAGEPATGSIALEAEALSLRTWGWIVFRYRMHGAVTWEMDGMRHEIDARRCWTDPMCSGYGINGDTVLFYLGELIGLPGRPVSSIRAKNMRRGSQDHEYLGLLVGHDGDRERADAIARAVVPQALDDGLEPDGSTGRWAHDPRRYEDARREIADLLSEPPTPEPDAGSDAGPDAGPPDGGRVDAGAEGGGDGCHCRAFPRWVISRHIARIVRL
jgi:hypothetical protein